MCKNSNNQAGNEVALNVIAMNAMWVVGVRKVIIISLKVQETKFENRGPISDIQQ